MIKSTIQYIVFEFYFLSIVVASTISVKNHSCGLVVLTPEKLTLLSALRSRESLQRESPEFVSARSFIQFFPLRCVPYIYYVIVIVYLLLAVSPSASLYCFSLSHSSIAAVCFCL